MTTQKQPLNETTTIAIESLGNKKVLLLSNGHVQLLADHQGVVHLKPDEVTKLYDFLLQYMSFIERRKQQNEQGN